MSYPPSVESVQRLLWFQMIPLRRTKSQKNPNPIMNPKRSHIPSLQRRHVSKHVQVARAIFPSTMEKSRYLANILITRHVSSARAWNKVAFQQVHSTRHQRHLETRTPQQTQHKNCQKRLSSNYLFRTTSAIRGSTYLRPSLNGQTRWLNYYCLSNSYLNAFVLLMQDIVPWNRLRVWQR